ncbi:hypothetical protein [Rossellomorea sp. LJF3]
MSIKKEDRPGRSFYTDETDLFEEVALLLLYVLPAFVNGQKPQTR